VCDWVSPLSYAALRLSPIRRKGQPVSDSSPPSRLRPIEELLQEAADDLIKDKLSFTRWLGAHDDVRQVGSRFVCAICGCDADEIRLGAVCEPRPRVASARATRRPTDVQLYPPVEPPVKARLYYDAGRPGAPRPVAVGSINILEYGKTGPGAAIDAALRALDED
jgi:hypothetical protein